MTTPSPGPDSPSPDSQAYLGQTSEVIMSDSQPGQPPAGSPSVGQLSARPKKKNKGLIFAGLLAVAIIAGLILVGTFGGSSKVGSYQKFQKAMQSASKKENLEYCLDETEIAGLLQEDLSEIKEQVAANLDKNPIDLNVYYCSNIDLSGEAAAKLGGPSSFIVVGVYFNDSTLKEHRVVNFMKQELNLIEGGGYGENWLVFGNEGTLDTQKVIVKKLNGDSVYP